MAELERERIKKLKRGEVFGNIAIAICAAALVFFIVSYSIAAAKNLETLKTVSVAVSCAVIAAGAIVAAYCNIVYTRAINAEIRRFIRATLTENAKSMHPERESLTFYYDMRGTTAELRANNYNDKILIDFSAFSKISPMRRAEIGETCVNLLTVTFLKLVLERGAKYSNVSYTSQTGRKRGRLVFIVRDGEPDKRAVKTYIKNR